MSSSGHLVIAETFLNLRLPVDQLQGFDVLLHAGSALALLLIYKNIWIELLHSLAGRDSKNRNQITLLIFATIPAAVIGVLFEEMIASTFRSIQSVAFALLVTAFVLILGERMNGKKSRKSLRPTQAFGIGFAQAFALIPGLSRSGLTLSTARTMGLSRSEAVDFSFLMAMPIILGATVLTLKDLALDSVVLPSFSISIIGIAAAFVASWIAITGLRKWVLEHSLSWFAVYLIPIAVLLLSFA